MRSDVPLALVSALEEARRALRRRAARKGLLSGLFAGGLAGIFLASVLLLGGGPPLLGGIAGYLRGLLLPVSDLEAALALDREAGLPDSVSTAVEFWLLPERCPFHEAALAAGLDAAQALDPERVLAPRRRPGELRRSWGAALLAWALAGAAVLLPGRVGPGASVPAGASPAVERARAPWEGASRRPSRRRTQPAYPPAGAPPSSPVRGEKKAAAGGEERKGEESSRREEKLGRGRSGGAGGAGSAGKGGRKSGRVPSGLPRKAQGARAGDSAGASSSQGSPGGGAGEPGRNPRKSRRRKQRKKSGKPPAPALGKQGRKTSSPGGGMAAGTSRMGGNFAPVTHSWKSLERGGEEDSGGEDQDQEVDEERRKSRQRGGTQPSLRDRRPPPSRDLGLSQPGDQPGKGRGGPTPPKKDRGTAALILGLPLPDTIKGLPNPGTSRVEQERTSPREAPAPPAPGPRPEAGGRTAPPLPGGGAPAEESGVVERYFRRLRGARRAAPEGAGK